MGWNSDDCSSPLSFRHGNIGNSCPQLPDGRALVIHPKISLRATTRNVECTLEARLRALPRSGSRPALQGGLRDALKPLEAHSWAFSLLGFSRLWLKQNSE